MTSNGVGMGHLSRQLATIISSGGTIQPVLFSLSGALPRIIQADKSGDLPELSCEPVRYEYVPSRESTRLPKSGWRRALRSRYRSYRWHPYLRDRLVALAQEVQAQAVVFDGVFPYGGLLQARAALPGVRFIWMRRGMWQSGVPSTRLDLSDHFDVTLEPQDFAQEFDSGPTRGRADATAIPPISLTNVLRPAPQVEARRVLNLPADSKLLLVAPGSGALGSVASTIKAIQQEVRGAHPDWQIVVTKQAISRHQIVSGDGVHILDDVYPLARYLSAFDSAVSAAGYNAVHEFLSARLPTLLVPSPNHVTDDQVGRARGLAEMGVALLSTGNFEAELAELLDEKMQARLKDACATLPAPTGSDRAAQVVLEQASQGIAVSGTTIAKPRRPLFDARVTVSRGDISKVLFTTDVSPGFMTEPYVVEQLVEGASDIYRSQRARIARWLYR